MVATGPPIINSIVLSSFIASPNCEVNTTDLNLPVIITLQHDVSCSSIHVNCIKVMLHYRKYNTATHNVCS